MKDILDFDEAGCPRVHPAPKFVALLRWTQGDPCKAGKCPDWNHGLCPAYRAVNHLEPIAVTLMAVTPTAVKKVGPSSGGHREGYVAPGRRPFRW